MFGQNEGHNLHANPGSDHELPNNSNNNIYQPHSFQDNNPFNHHLSWTPDHPQPNGTLLFGAPFPGPPTGSLAMNQGWQQEGQCFNKLTNNPWRAHRYESQASDPVNTLCPSDVEAPSPAFEPSGQAWTVCSSASHHSADEDSQEEDPEHQPRQRKPVETSQSAHRHSLPTQRPLQPATPTVPRRKHRAERTRVAPVTEEIRSYRDRCILEGRELGLTYGAIRRRYDLPEAESTLRGRCRTLMKSKEQRVRKPVWQETDVSVFPS